MLYRSFQAPRNVVLTLLVGGPLLSLGSGCVFFEVRDELKVTNERLTSIDADLDKVDQSLTEANAKLASSDRSLTSINESMEPIRVSLRRIDDQLAGFRQTIENIDRALPGKISPDTPPPVKQEPTKETTPQRK